MLSDTHVSQRSDKQTQYCSLSVPTPALLMVSASTSPQGTKKKKQRAWGHRRSTQEDHEVTHRPGTLPSANLQEKTHLYQALHRLHTITQHLLNWDRDVQVMGNVCTYTHSRAESFLQRANIKVTSQKWETGLWRQQKKTITHILLSICVNFLATKSSWNLYLSESKSGVSKSQLCILFNFIYVQSTD